MKYRIEEGSQPAGGARRWTLELTSAGRAREFVAGGLSALPWACLVVAIFIPDLFGNYINKDEALPIFLEMMAGIFGLVVLLMGLWRAFRTARWEFGRQEVMEHTRTLLWRPEIGLEAPLSAIVAVERRSGGRVLALRLASGGEAVLARAWWGSEELAGIEASLRRHLGAVGKSGLAEGVDLGVSQPGVGDERRA